MGSKQQESNETLLSFETLQFFDHKDTVQVVLLKIFKMHLPKTELAAIGEYKLVDRNSIAFFKVKEKKARMQFMGLF